MSFGVPFGQQHPYKGKTMVFLNDFSDEDLLPYIIKSKNEHQENVMGLVGPWVKSWCHGQVIAVHVRELHLAIGNHD